MIRQRKDSEEKTAIAAARQEAEGALTEYLASDEGAGMGKMAGPVVSGTSALIDVAMEDDPAVDKGDAAALALRQTAAGAGGASLGSWLGGLAGGALGGVIGGPYGAGVGAGIGGAAGAQVGSKAMRAADTALFGDDVGRQIHSGQFRPTGAQPTHTVDSIHDPEYSASVGVGEKVEPRYGGKQKNLAELAMLRKRLNGGR
jgi:hypothetical protein